MDSTGNNLASHCSKILIQILIKKKKKGSVHYILYAVRSSGLGHVKEPLHQVLNNTVKHCHLVLFNVIYSGQLANMTHSLIKPN